MLKALSRLLRGLLNWLLRLLRLRPAAPDWRHGSAGGWAGRLTMAPWLSGRRRYRLYLPQGRRGAAGRPLLVMLHGCRQNPDSIAAVTRVNRLAEQHQFVVLYPQQSRRANPYHCWNWFDPANQRGNGETLTIKTMVEQVCGEHRLDRDRVYLAGLSAGAVQAVNLAVCYGELFAAVAAHSGLAFGAATAPWEARQAMSQGATVSAELLAKRIARQSAGKRLPPLLVIHGADDSVVAPVNAEQLVRQWLNAQQQDPDAAEVHQVTPADGYPYRLSVYPGGLHYYLIERLGHAWSGGAAEQAYSNPHGPDASALIWDFCRTVSQQARPAA